MQLQMLLPSSSLVCCVLNEACLKTEIKML
jgi:hypothetical protein